MKIISQGLYNPPLTLYKCKVVIYEVCSLIVSSSVPHKSHYSQYKHVDHMKQQ